MIKKELMLFVKAIELNGALIHEGLMSLFVEVIELNGQFSTRSVYCFYKDIYCRGGLL